MAESRSGARARAERRLKQLCCLSTGGMVNAPTLFRELHALLGFSYGAIYTVDDRVHGDIYFENPEPLALLSLSNEPFFQREVGPLWGSLEAAYRDERGPVSMAQALKVGKSDLFRSDFYNLYQGPAGQHDFIRLQLRENNRWIAMFGLYRSADDADFDSEDLRTFGRLEPFFAHALTPRTAPDAEYADSGGAGMLVAERDGRIRWMSLAARSLLQMALGRLPATLPAGLLRAAGELTRIEAGNPLARPPVWYCRSDFGRFTFSAFWLQSEQPGDSLIGITATRRVPVELRLFETLGKYPLPRRQAEVCLRLALGKSNERIAAELGIGVSSVITHRRAVYNRFEVQSREQLLRKLHEG